MFSSRGNISTDDDLDHAFQQGIYRVIGGSLTAGFTDGALIVYNCGEPIGGGIIIQIFVSSGNYTKKSRVKWYTVGWTSWV